MGELQTEKEIEILITKALKDNPHWEVDAWGLFEIVAKAQLAHTLKRLWGAVEQAHNGEPLDLSDEEFELFAAIQSEALAKCHRDRPDREKIADTVEVECHSCKYHDNYPMNCYIEPITSPLCRHRYELADKISALFPDIEQAKREERERIIKWGKEHCTHHSNRYGLRHTCNKCWQALKKEGD